MAATKLPVIKEAIKERLEGSEALEGITISTGKKPEQPSEFIWIYKGKATRDWGPLGRRPPTLKETVRAGVYLWVALGRSGDAKPAEDRAIVLFEAAEEALREDTTLGSAVFFQRIAEIEEIAIVELDGTWGCHILFEVESEGQI